MTIIKVYLCILILIGISKVDDKMKIVDKRNANDPVYQAKQWKKALKIVFRED